MTITARKAMSGSRKRRELWHRKFIFWSTVEFEGRVGFFDIRFDVVLRRWSFTKSRWLYLRPTTSREQALIGTDMRIDRIAP